MEPQNTPYRVGDITVAKIPELALRGIEASAIYPSSVPAEVDTALRGLGPGSVEPQTHLLHQSIHAWLVRTPTRVILIDTATGNDKERPDHPVLHRLSEPFLDRLRAAGVVPDEVDLVLHTHLHADHVGWNTRKVDGKWVPTFPNARYVFSGRERAYGAALAAGDGSDDVLRAKAALGAMDHRPLPGVYEDSIQPIVEAGLADEIEVDGAEVSEGIAFLPCPGHSLDHACIRLSSRGEHALFWGDVMHHPVQVARPDWNSIFCEFPDAAVRARRWAMDEAAATGALIFTTHFPESSVGRLTRDGDRFTWHYV